MQDFGESMPSTTQRESVTKKALETLKANPGGVRYSELVRKIQETLPNIPAKTIQWIVWNLDLREDTKKEVYKPARGLYRHTSFRDAQTEPPELIYAGGGVAEQDFYQPFADWLKNDLEDCTNAIPLGGNRFKDKFGTPDVIGLYKSRDTDIIKMPTPEVVSAEIKTDATDLIRAFGQACAYKLFSHRSYLVVPKDSPDEDLARLDSLCMIFGIGLVLFGSSKPNLPEFDIRVRAAKHEPDMFYVNKYLKMAPEELFS